MEKSHSYSLSLFLPRLGRYLLDALFPILCLGCRKEGNFLCTACFERIPEREYQECPVCRQPFSLNGAVCKNCRRKTSLNGLFIAAPYKHPLLEKTIHTFKYRFIEGLATSLASLLDRTLGHNSLELPELILPVPLHPRRLRYRGFNQAELLGRALGKNLAPQLRIPLAHDILIRTRFTQPQMKTHSAEERRANLSDAFQVPPDKMWGVAGKYIWLIDDVATTGTTLEECAKILKAAGAKKVWGIVVAR